jgi:hypothetical protein
MQCSVEGFVFDVASSSISWQSKKHKTVAMLTVESKYMLSANATKEAIRLRVLLKDMGFKQLTATLIHVNNQGCIALMHKPIAHSHAKHINIWHHFMQVH